MVRPAFKGDGALFPAIAAFFRVSRAWPTARGTMMAKAEVENRFPTKLRFPQGSEVWISGCPKFGMTANLRLTNPKLEAETRSPGLRRWPWVSAFLRNWWR